MWVKRKGCGELTALISESNMETVNAVPQANGCVKYSSWSSTSSSSISKYWTFWSKAETNNLHNSCKSKLLRGWGVGKCHNLVRFEIPITFSQFIQILKIWMYRRHSQKGKVMIRIASFVIRLQKSLKSHSLVPLKMRKEQQGDWAPTVLWRPPDITVSGIVVD